MLDCQKVAHSSKKLRLQTCMFSFIQLSKILMIWQHYVMYDDTKHDVDSNNIYAATSFVQEITPQFGDVALGRNSNPNNKVIE